MGLQRPSINVGASTAGCDLDLWPPESNQVISSGLWIVTVSLIDTAKAVHEILW